MCFKLNVTSTLDGGGTFPKGLRVTEPVMNPGALDRYGDCCTAYTAGTLVSLPMLRHLEALGVEVITVSADV